MGGGPISRVPDVRDAERHRRAHDRLAAVLNDLSRAGDLTFNSVTNSWTVTPNPAHLPPAPVLFPDAPPDPMAFPGPPGPQGPQGPAGADATGGAGVPFFGSDGGGVPEFVPPPTDGFVDNMRAGGPVALGGSLTAANLTGTNTGDQTVRFVPGGRLTLTSGTAVTTSDVTGATSVYYTPYTHDGIVLWNGTAWVSLTFTEKTLALGTLTAGLPYDVFGYLSGGALALEQLAWASGTTRATGISYQDGRLCKTGDKTRLYLGTFYTTSTTATEDSATRRFLFNAYNQVARPLRKVEAAASWTYTGAYRPANNSTANRVEVVVGWAGPLLDLTVTDLCILSGGGASRIAVAEDSTTTPAADGTLAQAGSNASIVGTLRKAPAVGYHYYQWIENADTLNTHYGQSNYGLNGWFGGSAGGGGGGGGSGADPITSVYPQFTPAGVDDEFDDGSFTGWTALVSGTPDATVTELNNVCSVAVAGTNANPKFWMKAATVAVGDMIEVAARGFGRAVSGSGNHAVGVVVADGATVGSGTQQLVYYSPNQSALARVPYTNYATAGTFNTVSVMPSAPFGDVFVRLKYEAANTFSGWVSPDGVSWLNLTGSFSQTLTPSYVGFFVAFSATPFVWSLRYFRKSS